MIDKTIVPTLGASRVHFCPKCRIVYKSQFESLPGLHHCEKCDLPTVNIAEKDIDDLFVYSIAIDIIKSINNIIQMIFFPFIFNKSVVPIVVNNIFVFFGLNIYDANIITCKINIPKPKNIFDLIKWYWNIIKTKGMNIKTFEITIIIDEPLILCNDITIRYNYINNNWDMAIIK